MMKMNHFRLPVKKKRNQCAFGVNLLFTCERRCATGGAKTPVRAEIEAGNLKPEEFKSWRKSMGLGQREAADRLGLRKRMIQYYEKGEREGKEVEIPLTVALACFAVSKNVLNYDGVKAKKIKPSAKKAKIAKAGKGKSGAKDRQG